MTSNVMVSRLLLILTACLPGTSVFADAPALSTPSSPTPVITIKVTGKKRASVSHPSENTTVITRAKIESNPGATTLNQVIAASVAGAAQAPDGDIHIRGSHGQYSYYLDGAPLPADVTGSFSDLINPKDIETLRVYTGGFPAQYGGQMAAIFDVTAKAGSVGKPEGFLQQVVGGDDHYETTGQYGATDGKLSYFLSGVANTTDVYLSPISRQPYHDAGTNDVGFLKLDYQQSPNDRWSFDVTRNAAKYQIPNTLDRQGVGQDDDQSENSGFANLIWRHTVEDGYTHVALYSHQSHKDYAGSPGDLIPSSSEPAGSGLISTSDIQTANEIGLRVDSGHNIARHNQLSEGFDISAVTGKVDFSIISPPSANVPPITDIGPLSGEDKSAYLSDDFTTGRENINCGVRYDQHKADITTSQFSPRLNTTYQAGNRDSFILNYDRLFQPASVEDVKDLVGNSNIGQGATYAPFQPERDNFYEGGWQHKFGTTNFSFDTYYRDEKNTIDDATIGSTEIDVPVNFVKGFTKGLEWALDGDLAKNVTYYLNYARSWAKEAGPISGGLTSGVPTSYFYDDHDQTNTVSFAATYSKSKRFVTVDGEYGSGFPYGQVNNAQGNPVLLDYVFVPPHLTIDLGGGFSIRNTDIAMTVDNLANHFYIVKEATPFSDVQWSRGRIFTLKITQNF